MAIVARAAVRGDRILVGRKTAARQMVCRAEVTFMAELWNVESGENRRPIDFIIETRAVRVRYPRFDVEARQTESQSHY